MKDLTIEEKSRAIFTALNSDQLEEYLSDITNMALKYLEQQPCKFDPEDEGTWPEKTGRYLCEVTPGFDRWEDKSWSRGEWYHINKDDAVHTYMPIPDLEAVQAILSDQSPVAKGEGENDG